MTLTVSEWNTLISIKAPGSFQRKLQELYSTMSAKQRSDAAARLSALRTNAVAPSSSANNARKAPRASATSALTTRSAGPAKPTRVVVSPESLRQFAASLIQQGRSANPQSSPAYNEFYSMLNSAHARSVGLPFPRPFHSGKSESYKYHVVEGGTASTPFTIPAGSTAVIFSTPNLPTSPMRILIGAGTPVTSRQWGLDSARKDETPTATTDTVVPWAINSPIGGYVDAGGVKSGSNLILPSTTDYAASYVQPLKTLINVTVATPYDGSATINSVSPHDTSKSSGAYGPQGRFPANVGRASGLGYPPEFVGKVRGFAVAGTAATPMELCGMYNQASIIGGNAKKVVVVRSGPCHDWFQTGNLDAVDAAAGGDASANNNISPRDNLAQLASYFGMVVIQNTSAVTISGTASFKTTEAMTLLSDDASRSVSAIANQIFRTAASLREHHPVPGPTGITLGTQVHDGNPLSSLMNHVSNLTGVSDRAKQLLVQSAAKDSETHSSLPEAHHADLNAKIAEATVGYQTASHLIKKTSAGKYLTAAEDAVSGLGSFLWNEGKAALKGAFTVGVDAAEVGAAVAL